MKEQIKKLLSKVFSNTTKPEWEEGTDALEVYQVDESDLARNTNEENDDDNHETWDFDEEDYDRYLRRLD